MAKPKKYAGESILEVWDYRMSKAVPSIHLEKTWMVKITDKATGKTLDVHDTGIEADPRDVHNRANIAVCYEWLRSQRDKYSLDNIDEVKPKALRLRELAAEKARIEAELEEVK